MGIVVAKKQPELVVSVPVGRPDVFLREYGFQIASRPSSGFPVWSRNGKMYDEKDAVKIAIAERIRSLKTLETL